MDKKVYSITMINALLEATKKYDYVNGEKTENMDLVADWFLELAENADKIEIK